MIFRHFLGYLGDELNRACVGNGTGAERESFCFQFWKKSWIWGSHTALLPCTSILISKDFTNWHVYKERPKRSVTFQTFDQSDEENLTIKSDTGQHSQFLKCRLILQRRRQCICMMSEILKPDIPTHWAGWVKSPKQARMSSDLLERHIGKTCLVTNPVLHSFKQTYLQMFLGLCSCLRNRQPPTSLWDSNENALIKWLL